MNPFYMTAHCNICGKAGAATSDTHTAQWKGETVVHSNPNICIANLKAKENKKKK